VSLEVTCEVIDALREQGDLNFGRPSVAFGGAVLGHDLLLNCTI
jgi:hypothetical protein